MLKNNLSICGKLLCRVYPLDIRYSWLCWKIRWMDRY